MSNPLHNAVRVLYTNGQVITLRFGSLRTTQRQFANLEWWLDYYSESSSYFLTINTIDGRIRLKVGKDILAIQQVN